MFVFQLQQPVRRRELNRNNFGPLFLVAAIISAVLIVSSSSTPQHLSTTTTTFATSDEDHYTQTAFESSAKVGTISLPEISRSLFLYEAYVAPKFPAPTSRPKRLLVADATSGILILDLETDQFPPPILQKFTENVWVTRAMVTRNGRFAVIITNEQESPEETEEQTNGEPETGGGPQAPPPGGQAGPSGQVPPGGGSGGQAPTSRRALWTGNSKSRQGGQRSFEQEKTWTSETRRRLCGNGNPDDIQVWDLADEKNPKFIGRPGGAPMRDTQLHCNSCEWHGELAYIDDSQNSLLIRCDLEFVSHHPRRVIEGSLLGQMMNPCVTTSCDVVA